MIYTFEDVEILVKQLATEGSPPEMITEFIESWMGTYECVKREFGDDVKEVLLEILGPYLYGFSRVMSKKVGLMGFIFDAPLDEMPLYINSEIQWQAAISLWRIAIEK